jgi:nitrogen regulatory protein P-II 1
MKQIKAVLRPDVFTRVVHALHELPHFPGLTVFDVVGQGRGRGKGGEFVVTEESLFFHRNKIIEMVAPDDLVDRIVELIQKTAHTGKHGDGLIVVTEIAQCIRVRTGESQEEAL